MKSESTYLQRSPWHGQGERTDPPEKGAEPVMIVGRYALYDEIASGGMATVHYGRLVGEFGFSRTVAIKRMHPHFAKDQEFAMFVDEARILGRIRHPNVVPIIDVVAKDGELLLVMEYVAGETLSRICQATLRAGRRIPPRLVSAVFVGVLDGLHAAHEAMSELGEPLEIVHRDMSPQNIMIGQDGVARVIDWGVAKAVGRIQTTRTGQLKGKIAYMAPEQITGDNIDRRADIYSTGITIWELLTGRRLFKAPNEIALLRAVLSDPIPPPITLNPELLPALNDVVVRATQRDPALRFKTAREMAVALENAVRPDSSRDVAQWLDQIAGPALRARSARVAEIESACKVVAICKDASTSGVRTVPEAGQIAGLALGANSDSAEASSLSVRVLPVAPGADAVPSPLGAASSRPANEERVRWRRRLAIGAVLLTVGLACSFALGWKLGPFRAKAAAQSSPAASASAVASSEIEQPTQPPATAAPTESARTDAPIEIDLTDDEEDSSIERKDLPPVPAETGRPPAKKQNAAPKPQGGRGYDPYGYW